MLPLSAVVVNEMFTKDSHLFANASSYAHAMKKTLRHRVDVARVSEIGQTARECDSMRGRVLRATRQTRGRHFLENTVARKGEPPTANNVM